MPGIPTLLLTAAMALCAVLGLIWLAAAAARRVGIARRFPGRSGRLVPDSELALDASLALDPRRRLHLLRCAGQQVLVLTGGPQDLLLGWLPPQGTPGGTPQGTTKGGTADDGPAA